MLKAVVYARYSSDNQREESIDAQIRGIEAYAKNNNIQIVKIYTDEALSATTDNRPGFLKMIKDSSLKTFDIVIVHKLDRFARNRYDSAFYKRELKLNRVRLISVLENLDDSPESIILESVLEGMAEYYSANLSRETKKGLRENAYKCKHTGGTPALGYDVAKDKTYIINEKESEAVEIIFNMYADGFGYTPILEKLNKIGYKTKRGNDFGKNSLHDILKNDKYIGIYTYSKYKKTLNGKSRRILNDNEDEVIRIPDGMPIIINNKIWKRVQDKMEKNKRAPATNKAKEIYLLSGIVYCGKCRERLVGNRRKSGRSKTIYISYDCSSGKNCSLKGVKKEYIEELVINELEEKLFSDEGIAKLTNKILEHAKSEHIELKADMKIFEKELEKTQSKIDNIVNAIADGMFHKSMKGKMDLLEIRKNELISSLNKIKHQAQVNYPTTGEIKEFLKLNKNIKDKTLDEQRKAIQSYVKKVIVTENNVDVEFYIVDINGTP